MAQFTPPVVLDKIKELLERSKHVGNNVTLYSGPELGRLALLAGPEGLNILGAVGKFWPVILILVGLYLIIWRARPRS